MINRYKFSYLSVAIMLQIVMAFGFQVLRWVFRLAIIASDEYNLDKNNLFVILSNPISVFLLALFLIVFAFFFLVEFSTLVSVIYVSQAGGDLELKEVLKQSLRRLKNIFGIQFLYFLLYLIVTIPLAGLVIGSSLTEHLYVPDFITGEFMKSTSGLIGTFVVLIGFVYLNARLLYVVPYLITKDQPFLDSVKDSWKKTRKGLFPLLISIGLFEFILSLAYAILVFLLVGVVSFLDPSGQNRWMEIAFLVLVRVFSFAFSVFTKLGVLSILVSGLQHENKAMLQPRQVSGRMKWLFLGTVGTLLAVSISSAYDIATATLNQSEMIIAHRGDIRHGVENSLEALEAASENKANAVEMDILLTKDNQFVVMHDNKLKRLAGIDRRVQDMTLEELQKVEITQDGHRSHISSFEDYVKRAKELHMPLLVELKPHGGEPSNYADLFIAEAKRLGIEKEYRVMSLDLDLIQEIEEKDPAIETGYVIPIQFGLFAENQVDFYVIEDFSYRQELVTQAHQENKKIFVWTINDSQKIENYLQRPVDAIITDETEEAASIRQELKQETSYFNRFLRLLDSDSNS
ncbi:glycerophosphoryl diester phosphodiesterase membrane domain-containing protein [Streptococcus sp. DD13]|uniref:glycerophosphoryl diester phosphodiesterase membrane domain-containing protein n=1 Tax=Streptococcus sp. DD13 TaxID=1777881 RepID=UPI0008346C0A|nr:glycerophosphodiester phosphodiesterase [Streptococcus sp. DD13]